MTTVAQQATGRLKDKAAKFSMRGLPLLSEGTSTIPLAIAEHHWISAKVYAGGGENALHSHSRDDHAFFILAGSAKFFDADGGETELGPMEGILIPCGAEYRFQSTSDENLVILRMAGAEEDYDTATGQANRQAPDGTELASTDPRNHPGMKPRKESGKFFGM